MKRLNEFFLFEGVINEIFSEGVINEFFVKEWTFFCFFLKKGVANESFVEGVINVLFFKDFFNYSRTGPTVSFPFILLTIEFIYNNKNKEEEE